MAGYFFDTSALVKRYVNESGSPWVQSICDPLVGNQIIISRLTFVELHSALAKSYRMRLIDQQQLSLLATLVERDTRKQYHQIVMHRSIYSLAARLTLNFAAKGLRAYDAMQLACALYTNHHSQTPFYFVTGDDILRDVADQVAIATIDPSAQP